MKKYLVFVLAALLIGALATGGLAAGKSNVGHLYLYEKNPADWDAYPIPGGAWGKLKYNLSGPEFEFVFNGHGLETNTDYSLIYYADGWPGDNPGAFIGSGTSNRGGNIHLADSVDLGFDLPDSADANYPDGAKIWLVLSNDYDAENCMMIAWNPTEYLFENNLITYDDTQI